MKLNTRKKRKTKISVKAKSGSAKSIDKKKFFLIGGISLGCLAIAAIIVLALYFTNVIGPKPDEIALFSGAYMLDVKEPYDGKAKSVVAQGYPSGTNITYTYSFENSATGATQTGEGNSFIESGNYTITALLKKDGYKDKTLNATLKITRDYTVTFKQDGFSDRVFYVAEGGTLGNASVPSPFHRNGYTCIWQSCNLNNITKDIVVECTQIPYTYSIEYWPRGGVFDTPDGKNPNPTTYTVFADNFELAVPTRPDAIFAGWVNEDGGIVTEVRVSNCKNMLLKAKWISVEQTNTKITLSKSEDELSWVVGEFPPIVIPPYVQPEVPDLPPMGQGEALKDTDPSTIPSNEDPTEKDGSIIDSGSKGTTGTGEQVKVDDPKDIDVGGEKKPDIVDVEQPDPENPGGVVVVKKTAEEIDAESYVPETAGSVYLVISAEYQEKPITKILDAIYTLDEDGKRVYTKKGVFFEQTFGIVYISDSVTYIGSEAFRSCENMETVRLPQTLVSIGAEAFRNSGLEKVDVSMLTELSDGLFMHCLKLAEVTLSDNLVAIGEGCFSDCFSLEKLSLSSTLTTIGKSAFSSCIALTEIDYNGSLVQWEALVEANGGKENIGLKNSVIVNCLK